MSHRLRDADPSRIGSNTYPQALYCTRAKHILYAVSCCKNPVGANQSASAELAMLLGADTHLLTGVVWDGTMCCQWSRVKKTRTNCPSCFPFQLPPFLTLHLPSPNALSGILTIHDPLSWLAFHPTPRPVW